MPPRQNTDDFAWSPTIRAIILTLIGVLTAALAAIPAETVKDAGPSGDAALAGILLAGNLQSVAPAGLIRTPVAALPAVVAHLGDSAPRPASSAVKHSAAAAPTRWVPSGTGMWTYVWNKTENGNALGIVNRARSVGIKTVYLRTGSLHELYLSQLRALLLAARGTGIRVVAWDFPTLRNPVADAKRLATAGRYRVAGQGVAAVAPDIETRAEGTHLSIANVHSYLATLRRLLPRKTSIFPTVPWPSQDRIAHYPYNWVSRYADALIPMAYWYNHSSYRVTNFSIRYLSRYGKPVIPEGQGFDSRVDAPYLPPSNQPKELDGFLRAARQLHARAISLWVWQTASPVQWTALRTVRNWFDGSAGAATHQLHITLTEPTPLVTKLHGKGFPLLPVVGSLQKH